MNAPAQTCAAFKPSCHIAAWFAAVLDVQGSQAHVKQQVHVLPVVILSGCHQLGAKATTSSQQAYFLAV